MRIHFDEGKATVSLQASLQNIAKVLEQRNQVILCGVRGEVANIAGGLPLRGLLNNHIIALNTMGWEMVVGEGCSWGHAHGCHSLLLGDGRLALLVSPVAANGTRTEPFAIHGAQGLVSVRTLTESNETIATRASGLHIPHHTGLGYGTKGTESLHQNLIIDFIAQVTNENMEVVGGIFLVGAVGLVGPVDANFL